MAQEIEQEEDEMTYYCHNCDSLITEVEQTDDGVLICKICNGMLLTVR